MDELWETDLMTTQKHPSGTTLEKKNRPKSKIKVKHEIPGISVVTVRALQPSTLLSPSLPSFLQSEKRLTACVFSCSG